MKKLYGTGLLVAGLLIVSCSGTKKGSTAQNNGSSTKKKIACSEHKMDADVPHLDWIVEDNAVLEKMQTLTRPTNYKVYSLDSAQAKTFFNTAKTSGGKTVIPLPAPYECKSFSLSESGAMSDKLKAKYPDIVSLKGTDEDTKKSDVRLDFDGNKVRGQIIWGGEVYLITPVRGEKGYYYMVYAKKDTGEKKGTFETTTPAKSEPAYDR
jgi:hypothetical protein